VHEYRQRVRAEATYQDEKTRGIGLDASKITALERIERLLLPPSSVHAPARRTVRRSRGCSAASSLAPDSWS